MGNTCESYTSQNSCHDRIEIAPVQLVRKPDVSRVLLTSLRSSSAPPSSAKDKPSSGRKEKPSSGRKEKPSSGRKEKPSSGRKEKPSSDREEKPSSDREEKPCSGRKETCKEEQVPGPESPSSKKRGGARNKADALPIEPRTVSFHVTEHPEASNHESAKQPDNVARNSSVSSITSRLINEAFHMACSPDVSPMHRALRRCDTPPIRSAGVTPINVGLIRCDTPLGVRNQEVDWNLSYAQGVSYMMDLESQDLDSEVGAEAELDIHMGWLQKHQAPCRADVSCAGDSARPGDLARDQLAYYVK